MSNCGGFYDLVPDAKRKPANPSPVQPSAPKRETESPETQNRSHPNREEPAKRKKNNGGKAMILLMGAVLVCFVFMLVSVFMLSSKISDNAAEIEKLRSEVDQIPSSIDALKDSLEKEKDHGTTVPSGVTETTQPPYSETETTETTEPDQQDISVSFEIDEDGEWKAEPEGIEIGDYDISEIDGDAQNGFSVVSEENEDWMTVEIERAEGNDWYDGTISCEVSVEEAFFDGESEPTYQWRWWDSEQSYWKPLTELQEPDNEEQILQQDDVDGFKLSYDQEALDEWQADGDLIELQLTYTCESEEGTLEITISGITVSQEND